ncbi:hypothetical protein HU200_060026 [Digitaria exilis]|uniref:Cytochrome P450 n=1 Tax=Digitaria exilis TaxID=1010633 RepID=A0A835AH98_9POAL|nr:hypothetical protein HU200_060026 [Digitaria exilis]
MDNNVYYYILAILPLVYFFLKYCKASLGSHSHGFRLPPGPWQLPVIGSLHHLRGSLPHHALRDLSLRYGPLMFLKFGEVPLRKICYMELLSAKRVQSFRPMREEEATRLVHAIAISSTTSPLVNLSKLIAIYVADASVHAIMGSRFVDREALLRHVDNAVRLAAKHTLSDLFPSSSLAHALCRTVHKAETHRKSMFSFMDQVVCEHVERRLHGKDVHQEGLIDVLLRIQEEGQLQFPLTMTTIEAVLFDLFAGGAEIATTTLQWAMAELLRNPAVMSKGQAEVRGVFTGEMKVTEESLSRLSYLQLVIKETLRLHTSGPLLIPRECQEHCRVLGYDVPKGTMVLVNAFNPERFLADTRDLKGNDFDFIPFGTGRRICPGMSFGLANITLGLANLLFYFDWSLPEGINPSELDMTETMGITARRKADLMLSATLHFPLPS